MILGSKRRGPLGTPFDPETGEGHVEHRDGHYADALKRGKKVVSAQRIYHPNGHTPWNAYSCLG